MVSEVVVMDNPRLMVSDNVLVAVKCVGEVESVTVMTTLLVPVAVGFPVIVPLEGSMLNPLGRPVADQV